MKNIANIDRRVLKNYNIGKSVEKRSNEMEIKERIRMLMEGKHLSQKELANLSGITEASMSKYLSGERTPRIDVVVNIANALGVTTDELIGNDIEDDKMGFVRLKTVLARGMESMSEEDKKELIKFLLEN